jgi:uncharacterized membrane protein
MGFHASLGAKGETNMAFCASCGTELGAAATCPKCGKAAGAGPAPTASTDGGTGLPENVAGLLSYVLGWVTGLVFFLIDKRPSVRFHAMQSIIIFGAVFVIQIASSVVIGGMISWMLATAINGVVALAAVACWIICMIKAYGGERFKLPVVGDLAEQYSK